MGAQQEQGEREQHHVVLLQAQDHFGASGFADQQHGWHRQADGGEHRAIEGVEGPLQLAFQRGLDRIEGLRQQDQHRHEDAGQGAGQVQLIDPALNQLTHRFGDHHHDRQGSHQQGRGLPGPSFQLGVMAAFGVATSFGKHLHEKAAVGAGLVEQEQGVHHHGGDGQHDVQRQAEIAFRCVVAEVGNDQHQHAHRADEVVVDHRPRHVGGGEVFDPHQLITALFLHAGGEAHAQARDAGERHHQH